MSLWRENMQIPKKEQERKEGGRLYVPILFMLLEAEKNIATILNLQKTDVLRAFLYKTIDF